MYNCLPVALARVELKEDVSLTEGERRRVGRLETVERLQHGAAVAIHYLQGGRGGSRWQSMTTSSSF